MRMKSESYKTPRLRWVQLLPGSPKIVVKKSRLRLSTPLARFRGSSVSLLEPAGLCP